jgi:hypothetical protein
VGKLGGAQVSARPRVVAFFGILLRVIALSLMLQVKSLVINNVAGCHQFVAGFVAG